ncbi:MAG TPA: alpha/beta hydrolase [Burkholderiales bacterium]|nr:alpha/beta hydrolase [Burkholderiales bacterium]
MATYVLVHGAYHGGWCWQRVTERLRAAGHAVHVLTHTGSGERAHLLRPGLDISVYAQDLFGLVESEGLSGVILVGHSFGGMTLTAAAERNPAPFRHLVYFDALVPKSGEMPLRDRMPPEVYAERLKQARDVGGVPCFMPPRPGYFGVLDPADAEWVKARLTPLAVSLMECAVNLALPIGNGLPVTYVRCTAPRMELMDVSERRARELGWPVVELATGHDAMVSDPQGTTDILLSLAGR